MVPFYCTGITLNLRKIKSALSWQDFWPPVFHFILLASRWQIVEAAEAILPPWPNSLTVRATT